MENQAWGVSDIHLSTQQNLHVTYSVIKGYPFTVQTKHRVDCIIWKGSELTDQDERSISVLHDTRARKQSSRIVVVPSHPAHSLTSKQVLLHQNKNHLTLEHFFLSFPSFFFPKSSLHSTSHPPYHQIHVHTASTYL